MGPLIARIHNWRFVRVRGTSTLRRVFFPYNPRLLRIALFLCSVASVALAAGTLASARASGELTDWARLGVAVGLLTAFTWVFFRVWPREGWGVRVEPLGVTVARPLTRGPPLELVWSQVIEVRRDGRRSERILIRLRPEGRVLLGRHLFASRAEFDKLSSELEAKAPRADA